MPCTELASSNQQTVPNRIISFARSVAGVSVQSASVRPVSSLNRFLSAFVSELYWQTQG